MGNVPMQCCAMRTTDDITGATPRYKSPSAAEAHTNPADAMQHKVCHLHRLDRCRVGIDQIAEAKAAQEARQSLFGSTADVDLIDSARTAGPSEVASRTDSKESRTGSSRESRSGSKDSALLWEDLERMAWPDHATDGTASEACLLLRRSASGHLQLSLQDPANTDPAVEGLASATSVGSTGCAATDVQQLVMSESDGEAREVLVSPRDLATAMEGAEVSVSDGMVSIRSLGKDKMISIASVASNASVESIGLIKMFTMASVPSNMSEGWGRPDHPVVRWDSADEDTFSATESRREKAEDDGHVPVIAQFSMAACATVFKMTPRASSPRMSRDKSRMMGRDKSQMSRGPSRAVTLPCDLDG